ncbi:kinase-like domain-containing protein [Rhizophagus clarus]|uniref:Kinase-like domain-containing protein n=1 Tax=Rhizophagus clarus TaxID=94130 RepID=A0A8H3M5Y6_9GLOM|nr:kinase-like domain-containing protein [Rhizophagus clarus]
MLNLVDCYNNGEGIEKNLEKAFYWHQKIVESNKGSFKVKVELCNECKQPHSDYQWCQQCNSKRFEQDFSKWTRGFSKIHKAIWLDGPVNSWNFDRQQWKRWNFQIGYEVVLKILNNSSCLNNKFLDEWKYHYNCQKKSFSKFIQIFGITQDPNNLNYIIDGDHRFIVPNIGNKLKNDMFDFIKANDVLEQGESNISIQSHPQAYCTSRNLTDIISECLDYMIC